MMTRRFSIALLPIFALVTFFYLNASAEERETSVPINSLTLFSQQRIIHVLPTDSNKLREYLLAKANHEQGEFSVPVVGEMFVSHTPRMNEQVEIICAFLPLRMLEDVSFEWEALKEIQANNGEGKMLRGATLETGELVQFRLPVTFNQPGEYKIQGKFKREGSFEFSYTPYLWFYVTENGVKVSLAHWGKGSPESGLTPEEEVEQALNPPPDVEAKYNRSTREGLRIGREALKMFREKQEEGRSAPKPTDSRSLNQDTNDSGMACINGVFLAREHGGSVLPGRGTVKLYDVNDTLVASVPAPTTFDLGCHDPSEVTLSYIKFVATDDAVSVFKPNTETLITSAAVPVSSEPGNHQIVHIIDEDGPGEYPDNGVEGAFEIAWHIGYGET